VRGNVGEERQASAVTDACDDEGFAKAVERCLLDSGGVIEVRA
jgi:hypothetical protein